MAEWKTRESLDDHIRRYGDEVGARDVADFARPADLTIRDGIRFTFRRTGRPRWGVTTWGASGLW